MADYIQLESGADKITLEDGSGFILLQSDGVVTDVFIVGLHAIRRGIVAITAAGMGGVLQE